MVRQVCGIEERGAGCWGQIEARTPRREVWRVRGVGGREGGREGEGERHNRQNRQCVFVSKNQMAARAIGGSHVEMFETNKNGKAIFRRHFHFCLLQTFQREGHQTCPTNMEMMKKNGKEPSNMCDGSQVEMFDGNTGSLKWEGKRKRFFATRCEFQ